MPKTTPLKTVATGDFITCPNCDLKMYQFVIGIVEGQSLKAYHISALNSKVKPIQGNKTWHCQRCDAIFKIGTHIHLASGWFPKNPMIK